jgi:hypothetical protein
MSAGKWLAATIFIVVRRACFYLISRAAFSRKLLFRLRVLGKEADDRAVSDQHHGDGRRDDGANAEVVGRERHATAPVITATPHNEN